MYKRQSFSDIFFLKSPFFWMLRLLAAKFSRSVRVPADQVRPSDDTFAKFG